MSLWQKKCIVFTVMLGVPVLLCLIGMALEYTGRDVFERISAIALLAVIAGYLLHLWWMRCPHCGRHLDRNNGDYCQYCGEEIDWDGKPGKE